MENIKLAIIYYSSTGTNFQMAQRAAEAAQKAGAEVRLLKIAESAPEAAIQSNPSWVAHIEAAKDVQEVSLADLEWADAFIFSFPTRYGNQPSQFRAFIDTTGGLWFQGKLANKVVSAMTSAQNPHGGQETTLLSFYATMMHWGAIIATPGYTSQAIFAAGGNPYGASVTAAQESISQEINDAIAYQAERTVLVAKWVKTGLTSHQ